MKAWRPPAYMLMVVTAIVNIAAIVVAGVVLYDVVFNELRSSAINLQLTQTNTVVSRIRATATAAIDVRSDIYAHISQIEWGHLTRANATTVLFERMLPALLSYIVNSNIIQGTEVAIMLPQGIDTQANATAYVLCSIYYDIVDAVGTRLYYIIVVAPTFQDQLYYRLDPDPALGMLKPSLAATPEFVFNNSLDGYFRTSPASGERVSPYVTHQGIPYFFTTSYSFYNVQSYVMEVAVYALLDSWYTALVSLAHESALLIVLDPLTNVVIVTNYQAEEDRQKHCFATFDDFFVDNSCITKNYSSIGAPLIESVVSAVITPAWAEVGRPIDTSIVEATVLGDTYFITVSQLINAQNLRPIFILASPASTVDAPLRQQTIRIVVVVTVLLFVVSIVGSVVSSFLVARPIRGISTKMNAVELVDGIDIGDKRSLVREVASLQAHYANLAKSVVSFVHYVPRTVVMDVIQHRLIAEPSVVQAEAIVMFIDMTGFTAMWAALGDSAASDLMRRYFNAVVGALTNRRGIIDKYIGDIVMCMWRLPYDPSLREQQCVDALFAAIEAREAVEKDVELSDNVKINAGCHMGSVLIGNVGSRGRINYTILGDTVNISSRVLKKSRDFRQRRLATAALVAGTGSLASLFRFAPFQSLQLKGRIELVECCSFVRATNTEEPLDGPEIDMSMSMSLSMSVSNIYSMRD